MFAAMERAGVYEYSACSRNERVNFVFKPPNVACPSRSRVFFLYFGSHFISLRFCDFFSVFWIFFPQWVVNL